MSFALKLAKVERSVIQDKVARAAAILNLGDYLQRTPKELSGGQRQRVAIGRAIVRAPKVFLFDEPLSNLDAALRGQTRVEIAKLHRELGATTVYVTHDQVEAMTLADRVVVLRDGLIEQVGTPLALYDQPANQFVAQFIGTPPMNILASAQWPASVRTACPDPAQAASMGLRAEHLRVLAEPGPLMATVDLLEMLGSETLIYITTDQGLSLVARQNERSSFKPGQQVSLVLDLGHAHWFDNTGRVLKR